MQKARGHPGSLHRAPTACRRTVSGSLSPSSSEYFSPFPHGTSALSVREEYLALGDGPPRFPRGSTCPAVLGVPLGWFKVSLTGLSPTMAGLSRPFSYPSPIPRRGPTTPQPPKWSRFGLLRVRSPLLTESLLFSFPGGT